MTGMKIRKRLVAMVIGLAMAVAPCTSAEDVQTVAAAVDAHYNHLRTLQTEFTEVYRGSGMERTESGTLWLKKPGKMRWEYRSPREKLFVSGREDRLVLCSRGSAGAEDGGEEVGRCSLSACILAGQDEAGERVTRAIDCP